MASKCYTWRVVSLKNVSLICHVYFIYHLTRRHPRRLRFDFHSDFQANIFWIFRLDLHRHVYHSWLMPVVFLLVKVAMIKCTFQQILPATVYVTWPEFLSASVHCPVSLPDSPAHSIQKYLHLFSWNKANRQQKRILQAFRSVSPTSRKFSCTFTQISIHKCTDSFNHLCSNKIKRLWKT
jgi:hypothetical protein